MSAVRHCQTLFPGFAFKKEVCKSYDAEFGGGVKFETGDNDNMHSFSPELTPSFA